MDSWLVQGRPTNVASGDTIIVVDSVTCKLASTTSTGRTNPNTDYSKSHSIILLYSNTLTPRQVPLEPVNYVL